MVLNDTKVCTNESGKAFSSGVSSVNFVTLQVFLVDFKGRLKIVQFGYLEFMTKSSDKFVMIAHNRRL